MLCSCLGCKQTFANNSSLPIHSLCSTSSTNPPLRERKLWGESVLLVPHLVGLGTDQTILFFKRQQLNWNILWPAAMLSPFQLGWRQGIVGHSYHQCQEWFPFTLCSLQHMGLSLGSPLPLPSLLSRSEGDVVVFWECSAPLLAAGHGPRLCAPSAFPAPGKVHAQCPAVLKPASLGCVSAQQT